MANTNDTTRDARTQAIIDRFRGMNQEFYMLKGLLCLDHGWDSCSDARKQWRELVNAGMIASRMDEINRECVHQYASDVRR